MLSRRRMLAISAGVAVTGAIVAGGVADAGQLAPTRHTALRRRPLRGGHLQMPRCQAISHLALTWLGGRARVRLRTAGGWTPWIAVDGCPAAPDRERKPRVGALIVTAGAIGYEVWLTGNADVFEINTPATAPTALAAIRTPTSSSLTSAGWTSAGLTSASLTFGMPLPDGTFCAVPYMSRAAWGADESLRFGQGVETWPPEFSPAQTLTVHHTAGVNNDPDPPATMRAIYHYQAIGRGWGDIGYHLCIDASGVVYQGRWTGPGSGPVFGGEPDPAGVSAMGVGAHVLGFNMGNVGIALLGTYMTGTITTATRRSLSNVLAGLARAYGLNPTGITGYVNPQTGATKTVSTISGHRNWNPTDCPGDSFYPELPQIRADVVELINVAPARPRRPRIGGTPVPRRTFD